LSCWGATDLAIPNGGERANARRLLVIKLPELRDREPERMRTRRCTVEHPFGTLKSWMGYTHFQTRTLKRVSTEMSLHVLAYNMKRLMNMMGVGPLMEAIGD